MKVQLDDHAVMPRRAHPYDAGMDLHARNDAIIPPGGFAIFDTGVHVQIPESCEGSVRPRSGLMFKHQVVAGLGTIDPDYTGSINVILFNFGSKPYQVLKHDRIAQLVITPCVLLDTEQVAELSRTKRGTGGFGSTGR